MLLTRLFPFLAVVFALLAYVWPQGFISYQSWIVPLLMLVMLGMGFSLRLQDFEDVLRLKRVVALGVAIQFGVMPLAAFMISNMLGLSTALTIGMMLVGAAAGGTASNVMTYLARGHLALSVSMTLVSTLLAVFLMPLLTWLYLGQRVEVPAHEMMLTLLKLIVVPVAAGMLLRRFLGAKAASVEAWFPWLSVWAIVLIIGIVVALNHANLQGVALTVVVAVMLHNLAGMVSGYWLSRKLGYNSVIARTVALEVGMQNSGLSVALALKYFGAASALPGALFSIWHNLSGAAFAAYWQQRKGRSVLEKND